MTMGRRWGGFLILSSMRFANQRFQSHLLPGNDLLRPLHAEFFLQAAEGVDEDKGKLHEQIP